MFTFLRGSVVAVVLSLMMLSFAGKKPAKFMSGIAGIASVTMLVIIYLRRGITTTQDISTNYRLPIWKTCINAFLSQPYGLGGGCDNVRKMLFENSLFFANAHNLLIEIAAELGIAGLLVFAVLVIIVIRDLFLIYDCGGWFRRYATAFGASLVGFFAMSVFESTLNLPKEIMYLVIILACVDATKKLAQIKSGKV
jgi:O-antigen ligase